MADLVIRDARLYDGTGGPPVDDAVLVAEDGRVTYAGPARGAPPDPAGAAEIDGGGRALIPGLIDAHVHLCFDGIANFAAEAAETTEARAALKAARNARRALEAGITSVRDLGGHFTTVIEVARAQREGIVEGPHIVAAGQALTITGGHGHFAGFGRPVDTADEMVKAVREMVRAGAEAIKVVATGGVLTEGIGAQRSSFSVDQIAAAVNEAHEAGRRVAAHAIGAAGIVAALQAGVDSIEHGCYLTDESIKLLLDGERWLVPTLSAPERILHGGEGVPGYAVEKSREVIGNHVESFRRAAEAGVRVAAGTDAGTPFNVHGGLAHELRLMRDAGMPLPQVLRAATLEAAGLLGLDDAGALEPGRRADCVLLDGDPYGDAGAFSRVELVAQDGRVVVDRRGGF